MASSRVPPRAVSGSRPHRLVFAGVRRVVNVENDGLAARNTIRRFVHAEADRHGHADPRVTHHENIRRTNTGWRWTLTCAHPDRTFRTVSGSADRMIDGRTR